MIVMTITVCAGLRDDIGNRKARDDVFSETAARYYSAIDDLCRAIDEGDSSIGLPPYNGGLFDRASTPLLAQIRLGDQVVADVVDALSFEGGRYINYRDLSVEQLGSIYERFARNTRSCAKGARLRCARMCLRGRDREVITRRTRWCV